MQKTHEFSKEQTPIHESHETRGGWEVLCLSARLPLGEKHFQMITAKAAQEVENS
jgi:hypothetical protein